MVILNWFKDFIVKVVTALNDVFWGELVVLDFNDGETQFSLTLLIVLLIGAGIFFTIKLKGIQFSMFPEMIRNVTKKQNAKEKDAISGWQALMVATATRVGMGNLAGVVAAITFGGPGAVFWMWVTALVGASSAFVETVLAQIYKEKDPLYGGWRGGPAYYINRCRLISSIKSEDAFVSDLDKEANIVSTDGKSHFKSGGIYKIIAILFAISGLICWAGISQVVGNSVTSSFQHSFGISPWITAAVLTILGAIIVLRKRATVKVLDIMVPIMACAYILMTIFIIIKNITVLPSMFADVFASAFGAREMVSGGLGAVIMNGIKRGLFSNEAGSGSAPCAGASADVEHPVQQGLIQALGVYIDTIVICSCTAFVVLLTPKTLLADNQGMDLLQIAMEYHVGKFGGIFIAIILFLFSFSTFLGILYYARCNVAFLWGDTFKAQTAYKIFALAMLFIGGIAAYEFVWMLGDLGIALMTLFNMLVIVPLIGQVSDALKDYKEKFIGKR